MAVEENKAMMRRLIEEFIDKGDMAVADELIATDFINHIVPPGMMCDRESLKQSIADSRSAFPDLHVTLEDLIAEGDKSVARVRIRGTHLGDFMGIPATGKQIDVPGITILRFVEGKVVERWNINDDLGFMRQLGVIPTPGQGEA
ncbi:MAG: ester cyclase [Chloroflexota bacterium]|nr:ester cyclase [Chloroflexota bacterium]